MTAMDVSLSLIHISWLGLSRAYRGSGQQEEAVNALRIAQEIDEENPEVAYELGYAYIDSGQYAEAESLSLIHI